MMLTCPLVLLLSSLHLLPLAITETALCRFGDASHCVFPCLCTSGCDQDTGLCLPEGKCPLVDPDASGIRRSGPGCRIENIAIHKRADQLGIYNNLNADLAVNGEIHTDSSYCAHPDAHDISPYRAWWYVDLGQKFTVVSVTLYNRGDVKSDGSHRRLGKLSIHVTNTPPAREYTDLSGLCAHYDGPVPEAGHDTIQCDTPLTGQYVTVVRDRRNHPVVFESHFMSLCEVIVLGYEPIACDACPSGVNCSGLTGCRKCAPGFYYPNCTIKCAPGLYGDNCRFPCSGGCVSGDGAVCYTTNGSCISGCRTPALQTWYYGDRCDNQIPYKKVETEGVPAINDITWSAVTLIWSGKPDIAADLTGFYRQKVYFRECAEATQSTRTFGWQEQLIIENLKPDTTYCFQLAVIRQYSDSVEDEGNYKTTEIRATTAAIPVTTTQPTTQDITTTTTRSRQTTTTSTTNGTQNTAGISIPVVAGSAAAGGALLIVLVAIIVVLCLRKRRRKADPPRADVMPRLENGNLEHKPSVNRLSSRKPEGTPPTAAALSPRTPPKNRTIADRAPADDPAGTSDYYAFPMTKFVLSGTHINVEDLEPYIGAKKFTKNGFKQEFEAVPEGIGANCKIGGLKENIAKNRFKNIRPFDDNRIILEVDQDDDIDSYINASYITGYPNKEKCYVATQGPKPNTIDDFWKMIWQLNTNRIVMLTGILELGRQKCEQYWPKIVDEEETFDDITVTTRSSDSYAGFSLSVFSVQKEQEKREVRHFQFLSWPDKTCPDEAFPLLSFRRKVRSFDDDRSGPMVVHCSAGVGRSGTFIALDSLLDQMKEEGKLDAEKQLRRMRDERMKMIQTLSQYVFLHEALLEAYQQGETAIPCTDFMERYKAILRANDYSNETHIEEQFQNLCTLKNAKPPMNETGLKLKNAHLNRNMEIVPDEFRRVFLSDNFKGRTDYINAVMVDSFMKEKAFIVTQLPMADTIVDFWRMVYLNRTHTVVIMEPQSPPTEECPNFWPDEKDRILSLGPLEVRSIESEGTSEHMATLKVEVSMHSKMDEALIVKFIFFNEWTSKQDLPDKDDMLDLLAVVEKCQQPNSKDKMVIVCKDGARRCGLLCAAHYVLEKMKVDHEVDVFLAARAVALHRRQFITDTNQYKYIHSLAAEFIKRHQLYGNFK